MNLEPGELKRTAIQLQAEKADLIQALYTAEQALSCALSLSKGTAVADCPAPSTGPSTGSGQHSGCTLELEWPLNVVRLALARVGETEWWNEAGESPKGDMKHL